MGRLSSPSKGMNDGKEHNGGLQHSPSLSCIVHVSLQKKAEWGEEEASEEKDDEKQEEEEDSEK